MVKGVDMAFCDVEGDWKCGLEDVVLNDEVLGCIDALYIPHEAYSRPVKTR